uniref:Uncharacterized protein n=1 Tax=Solanum tuberosum TaxID=4113 RepID=M1AA41_SOLTU
MANEEAPIWKRKILTEEEEACRVNSTSPVKTRELVEIGSPLKFDSNNPWKIKKTITPQLLNLVISHSETFNYKLKYVKGKRKFSIEFEELVLDCLSSKESKRPSVGDLLQRPFFRYAKNLQWFQRRVLYAKIQCLIADV